MAEFKIRAAVRWMAPLAMVGVLGVAACGSDSDDTTTTGAARADVAGSDVHLQNRADDIARQSLDVAGSDVHLQNQADDIARQTLDVAGSDVHLQNQADDIAGRVE
jgi:hypothetical protein